MATFGEIFKEITQKDSSSIDSILGVEQEVERSLNTRLEIQDCNRNGLVSKRGCVFPHKHADIEAKISKYLD